MAAYKFDNYINGETTDLYKPMKTQESRPEVASLTNLQPVVQDPRNTKVKSAMIVLSGQSKQKNPPYYLGELHNSQSRSLSDDNASKEDRDRVMDFYIPDDQSRKSKPTTTVVITHEGDFIESAQENSKKYSPSISTN